ncbi:MAG: hypothetical protein ABI383_00685 [Acidobacteriaceae bacterium]
MPTKAAFLNAHRAQPGFVQDSALQSITGQPLLPTVGLNVLGVGVGFPGYTVPDAPPDTNAAVGDTQVVEWVNVSYAVFNKTTGAAETGPIAGNALWAGFGGQCQNQNSGDIIAQFDKAAHRWVLFQPVFSAPFKSCFAISTTADALGTYYRYEFPQNAGFPDYPKLGIMPNAYFQANNMFNFQLTAYIGAQPCAYERVKMLAGDPSAKQVCIFDNGGSKPLFDDSMLPADLDSPTSLPPAGADEVFLGSIDNVIPEHNVYQYLFHVDFTTPSNSTLTGVGGTMPIPVSSFTLACGNGGGCLRQKGTSDSLATLGDRLMYRLAYRSTGSAAVAVRTQSWLVNHAIVSGNSQAEERWYEFRAPLGHPTDLTVFQQGTYAPDATNRWMGSLAMDKVGNIIMGYSTTSSSTYPAINFTGRLKSDPLGQMQSEGLIFNGTGSQADTANRWGDYSSMSVDPNDGCTMWYAQEYYTVPGSTFAWSTRLASLKFPNCN